MGSLARNNFTFCPIKCFFFVLVLLALIGAALVQLDDMSQPGNSEYARRQSLSLRASVHKENIGERFKNLQVHRARCPTRGEITVSTAVSGRAFCAANTLPLLEQAAAESREQLAGHQASASLSRCTKLGEKSGAVKSPAKLTSVPSNTCNPAELLFCFTFE